MPIVIDLSFINEFLELPPGEMAFTLFIYGGWAILLLFILGFWWTNRLNRVRAQYEKSINYTLLAIDVPKENEQGPKAVEQIFAHLSGVESNPSWKEKYLQGHRQPCFSLEIISIEGYIQFLIRTPSNFRDLVEAAIYAQYPEAEITEVEDYTKNAPTTFPSEKYDLWGTELILYNKDAYPIKTYPEFEDPTSQEQFKDPMAALNLADVSIFLHLMIGV